MGGKKGKGGSKPQPLSFRLYASQQALETIDVDECPGQVSNINEKALTVKLPNNTTVPELLQWFASELTKCDVEATMLLMSGGNKEQKANITKIVSETLQEQLETQILSIGVDKLLEVKFTKAAKAAAQPPPPPPPPPAAAMKPPATPEALAAGPSATSPAESPAPTAAKPAQNGTAAPAAEKPASPKAAPKAAAQAAPAPATSAAPAQAKPAGSAMPPSPVKRTNSGSKGVSTTTTSNNNLVMAGVAGAAALAAIVGFALSRRR